MPFKVNYVVREFCEGRVITITRRMETVMERFRGVRWPGICISCELGGGRKKMEIVIFIFLVYIKHQQYPCKF